MEQQWDKNVAARHPQEPQPNDKEVQKFRSMADRETCWKIKTLITVTMCDPAFVGDLVTEVPLRQGLEPVPAALAVLAAGTEQQH